MPPIGGSNVGFAEGADVRSFKHLLQLLDVIDDALNIHREQYSGTQMNFIHPISSEQPLDIPFLWTTIRQETRAMNDLRSQLASLSAAEKMELLDAA